MDIKPRLFSDSIELMDAYIERMRIDEDFDAISTMLNRFNEKIFESGEISKDQLRQLAVYTVDKIYRFAAELEVKDAIASMYFKKVVARLMDSLRSKGIEVFYILDNEIREDRFELSVMLYELGGVTVVTPYDDDKILGFEQVEG